MANVALRNFEERDLDTLYIHMTAPGEQKLTNFHFRVNSRDEFAQYLYNQLRNVYHDFFIITLGEEEVLGYIYSYDMHILDGHLKVTICLFPEFTGRGLGPKAGALMLRYLFDHYPIRQVFTAVFAYNEESVKMHEKVGFREVARYPEYRYWQGAYYDELIYTMSRTVFEEVSKRILRAR